MFLIMVTGIGDAHIDWATIVDNSGTQAGRLRREADRPRSVVEGRQWRACRHGKDGKIPTARHLLGPDS